MEGGWRNKLAYLGLADLQMPIIHTWNVSLNMWNYHVNYRCASSPSALHRCSVHCQLLSKAATVAGSGHRVCRPYLGP